MPKRLSPSAAKNRRTRAGHVQDVKIERIGPVTIYQRGNTYYVYYREAGETKRVRIDGNLSVARATAADVVGALSQQRRSPFSYRRIDPTEMVSGYLTFVEQVQKRAWRTCDRYRAALDRYLDFARDRRISTIDRVEAETVEEFVRWLRGLTRCRNGAKTGKKDNYSTGGIKFILSTCRTAYNWARRNRHMPPYAVNPFSEFNSELLGDDESEREIFTPAQEAKFFAACSAWQRSLFLPAAGYGLRVGELTHLLIEDVSFEDEIFKIRAKPEMYWKVKTRDKRDLPLTGPMADLFRALIGERKSGFVFLNQHYYSAACRPAHTFASDYHFRQRLQRLATTMTEASERERRRVVRAFCRSMGQIPNQRLRTELCKLTIKIGCPEFTRAHDLRHLFGTRTQDAGGNPILVQQITGHRSMDMLAHYTHFNQEVKRAALEQFHTRFAIPQESSHESDQQ